MSTKALITVLASAASLALAGCSGEDKPYFTETKVSLKGTDCLAETISKLDVFVAGDLQSQEVEAFFDCALIAVDSIEKYVEGRAPGGGYLSKDIRWFVEKYFLKADKPDGIKISDTLLDELMEIKRLFLGGTRQALTRIELSDTRRVLREFKAMGLVINPHIKTLFHLERKDVAPEKVGRAVNDLVFVARRFGVMLQEQGSSYEVVRFRRLIEEITLIFDKKDKELPDWLKFITPLQKAKGVLLSTSEDLIGGKEWRPLFAMIGDVVSIFFRAKHFFNSDMLYSLTSLGEIRNLYGSVESLFTESLLQRTERPISKGDVDGLLASLEAIDSLPDSFGREDILSFWTVIVDKLLTRGKPNGAVFARSQLNFLTSTFSGWLESQRWLLGESVPDSEVLRELKSVLDSPWVYRLDSAGRAVFDGDRNQPMDLKSATRLNWLRAAFRLLIQGFAADPDSNEKVVGLTRSEVDTAFTEIKSLFVMIGLINKDDTSFQSRVFLESSLFMPRANGDNVFDLMEMIEYVHFVLAGIDAGKKFVTDLGPSCVVMDGEEKIDRNCFRQGFRTLLDQNYAHLPSMVNYLKGLKTSDFWKLLDNLEKSVRSDGASSKPVEKSDIYEMGILLQYIETLMLRFDMNRSSRLEIAEARMASPLFEIQLGVLIKNNNRDEMRRIFTFMLRYGEPPDRKNPLSLLRYIHWRMTERSWKVNADRGRLVNILAKLRGYL
jgi:hypothetical protein